jgi:hypothetical protein
MGRNTTRSDLAPVAPGLLGATTAAVLLASILVARGATPEGAPAPNGVIATPRARTETLWIFDADFEDLVGDNAGWTNTDVSGRPPCPDYWHKDTIRLTEEYLGDSTWWCGTSNPCWEQPRGYGNDWTCYLERDFPLSEWSGAGDEVVLEWDQRYAMEMYYDYGYVDVSTDGGHSWDTIAAFTNRGFQPPGSGMDWDRPNGHVVEDLGPYAGKDIRLRYRVESDCAFSSEDRYYDPLHSVTDGAWQLDNIEISINGATLWLDDCEAPGENGWVHEDFPGEAQTGVVFRRVYEEFEDPYTHELHSGWMMAAYDSVLGRLVNGQWSSLLSPVIDISGAPHLVGEWSGWLDLRPGAHDAAWVLQHQMTDRACVGEGLFGWGWLETELTTWVTVQQEWGALAGRDWLEILVEVFNWTPCDPNLHGLGFVLDRLRVGVPIETTVPDGDLGECRLELAGPSPFGTATTIGCETVRRGHVMLRIHDLSGRVVRSLVDGVIEGGTHELIWDGTTDSGGPAASGVYFVRMETSGFRANRKLVLLK